MAYPQASHVRILSILSIKRTYRQQRILLSVLASLEAVTAAHCGLFITREEMPIALCAILKILEKRTQSAGIDLFLAVTRPSW